MLTRSARRCCLCFYLDQDFFEKDGQIAHLDHDPGNGSEDNLAFLCLRHHSLYDSRTSQHKNYAIQEVKTARARLYQKVECYKPCEWMLVIDGPFSDFDKARVEAIAEHLRRMLRDAHVTIKKVSPGSVVLVVSSSEEALGLLNRLFVSGEQNKLLGYPIREIKPLDEGAFAQFFKENWHELVWFVSRRLGQPLEAEDAALYALTKAWETGNFSKWALLRMARIAALHRSLVFYGAARAEHRPEISELLNVVPTPEAILVHKEQSATLETALASLTPRDRAVLTLRYFDEWSPRDVAAALGVSEARVSVLVSRARKRLRQALARRGERNE